jgi:hypothetical protein
MILSPVYTSLIQEQSNMVRKVPETPPQSLNNGFLDRAINKITQLMNV